MVATSPGRARSRAPRYARERRRRRLRAVVAIVSGLSLTAGSVGTGLVVRYRRRMARGSDWVARSQAWWERNGGNWPAA